LPKPINPNTDKIDRMELMHSPEVELTEIFVSNIFNGNGLAKSDKK